MPFLRNLSKLKWSFPTFLSQTVICGDQWSVNFISYWTTFKIRNILELAVSKHNSGVLLQNNPPDKKDGDWSIYP